MIAGGLMLPLVMGSFVVIYNENIDLGVIARVTAGIDFTALNRVTILKRYQSSAVLM
jgi:hypothetical protein